MKIKQMAFYIITLLLFVAITSTSVPTTTQASPLYDYDEECLQEGCNSEEVDELYESYESECLDEGCFKEEVFELGGSTEGVQRMRDDFAARGWRIVESDFQALDRFCAGTTTQCYGVVLWCDDHCTYPDGSTSSSYACGPCVIFPF